MCISVKLAIWKCQAASKKFFFIYIHIYICHIHLLKLFNFQIKPKVGTVCFGVAASQGALLLAGGEKGMRYSMPNSRIMIHQPQSGCGVRIGSIWNIYLFFERFFAMFGANVLTALIGNWNTLNLFILNFWYCSLILSSLNFLFTPLFFLPIVPAFLLL